MSAWSDEAQSVTSGWAKGKNAKPPTPVAAQAGGPVRESGTRARRTYPGGTGSAVQEEVIVTSLPLGRD